jgi:hypothetical protein
MFAFVVHLANGLLPTHSEMTDISSTFVNSTSDMDENMTNKELVYSALTSKKLETCFSTSQTLVLSSVPSA